MNNNILINSTVFVAGGAGFVGSALVRELLEYCKKIVVFDNFYYGRENHLTNLGSQVIVISGDALDKESIMSAISENEVDYVFSCIGDTFVPDAYESPSRFFDINLLANKNILEVSHSCGVKRILYVSSTEVYGNTTVEKTDENMPLDPVNTYAVSKLAADRLCYTYHVEHGMPVVITRIFNCYGPRETHPYIIPEIIEQLTQSSNLYLGNIDSMRDFTYVHDTAKALISVLCSNIQNGDVVNVGSGVAYKISEIAFKIAYIMGIRNIKIRLDKKRLRKKDIDLFCCNNRKLVELTNWKPSYSFEQGLAETVEWYRNNGCKWSYADQTEPSQASGQ